MSLLDEIRHQRVDVQVERLERGWVSDLGEGEVVEYLARRPELLQRLLVRRDDVPEALLTGAARHLIGRFQRSGTDALAVWPALALIARRGGLPGDVRGRLERYVRAKLDRMGSEERDGASERRAELALGVLAHDPGGLHSLDPRAIMDAFELDEQAERALYDHPALGVAEWVRLEEDGPVLEHGQHGEPGAAPVARLPAAADAWSDLELARAVQDAARSSAAVAERLFLRARERLMASRDERVRAALLQTPVAAVRRGVFTCLGQGR